MTPTNTTRATTVKDEMIEETSKELLDITSEAMLRYSTRDLASTVEIVDMLLDIQAVIIKEIVNQ
jgi:hypothetical protein